MIFVSERSVGDDAYIDRANPVKQMANKFSFLFVTVFLFFGIGNIENSFAQNKSTDSLKTLLIADKEDTTKAIHLYELSFQYQRVGDFGKGETCGTESLALSQKLNFMKGLAFANKALGNIALRQGSYPIALDYYHKALKIQEDRGNQEAIAGLLTNIGAAYYHEGDIPNALTKYLASLKIAEQLNNQAELSSVHNNIGLLYLDQRKDAEALKSFQISLEIKKKLGIKKGVALAYNNIGMAYLNLNNYTEALKNHEIALKIAEEANDKYEIAFSYTNIGRANYSLTNYNEALKKLQIAIKLEEEIGDNYGMLSILLDMGEVEVARMQLKEARKYFNKALQLSTKIGAKQMTSNVFANLTKLDSLEGNWKLAFEHQRLYTLYKDSVDNDDTKKKILQTEMGAEFDKKEMKQKAEQDKKDADTFAEKKRQQYIIIFVSSILVLVFLFAGFIFKSLQTTRKQKQIIEIKNGETEQQKKIIEEKNNDITASIKYAKQIQTALLREEAHVSKHLPEHFILFLPKDIVSGDFYWGFEKRDYWYLAAADCTGHGVPGAIMSMLGISFLNDIVASAELHSPAEILDQLRDRIMSELRQTGEEGSSKDGMDISLIRLNLKTFELQWAGANNALNYIQEGELKEIKADKQPIGYHPMQRPFTNHEIQLQKGDSIYLYSDGYADQFGGPKGKKLTYKKLDSFIVENYLLPMENQKVVFKQYFEDWKGSQEQLDDVCVIGVKI